MSVFCISYTLESGNYNLLTEAIKSYGTYWHQSGSVWFIESHQNAKIIHEHLVQFLGTNDKLLVIKVQKNWWGIGYNEDEYDWMKERNFN